jgi:hypothetical protein
MFEKKIKVNFLLPQKVVGQKRRILLRKCGACILCRLIVENERILVIVYYSMLKSTLECKKNVDIAKYHKLRILLKRQSKGYKAKKSKVLSEQQIEKFIVNAPDNTFLSTKVSTCVPKVYSI